jgi:hypothetical protein
MQQQPLVGGAGGRHEVGPERRAAFGQALADRDVHRAVGVLVAGRAAAGQ